MIRFATHDDMARCVEMGRAFAKESGIEEIGFDEASAIHTLTLLIDSADGCLLVAEDNGLYGMAAALSYPHYMSHSTKVAQELFWWVEPAKRGGIVGVRLLRALEAWAKEAGCKTLTMICLPLDNPAERIYTKTGYRPLERGFIKEM